MDLASYLTLGALQREFPSIPDWKLRRTVDALKIECPRAGLYRMIPRDRIPDIRAELLRQGWLKEAVVHA